MTVATEITPATTSVAITPSLDSTVVSHSQFNQFQDPVFLPCDKYNLREIAELPSLFTEMTNLLLLFVKSSRLGP
jgi:hypothetical protein